MSRKKFVDLERDITVTSQYNRWENLVIDGIPDWVPQEDLEGICLDLVYQLGFKDVGYYEVVGCHRLKKRRNDVTIPVIIRFINRKIPEFCKKKQWKLKKMNFNNWNISLRDDLCEANDAILTECMKLRNDGRLFKVFTYNGFVKIVKKHGDQAMRLSHISDVHALFS